MVPKLKDLLLPGRSLGFYAYLWRKQVHVNITPRKVILLSWDVVQRSCNFSKNNCEWFQDPVLHRTSLSSVKLSAQNSCRTSATFAWPENHYSRKDVALLFIIQELPLFLSKPCNIFIKTSSFDCIFWLFINSICVHFNIWSSLNAPKCFPGSISVALLIKIHWTINREQTSFRAQKWHKQPIVSHILWLSLSRVLICCRF